jgi:hypothetical protein
VVLTGCSTTVSPPAVGASPVATSTIPKSEISNPLDISKFTADACAGLTAAQVAPYLGAVEGKDPGRSSRGPLCTFQPQDVTGPSLGVGEVDIATPTEESLYESEGSFPWRRKISPIASYPAVNASADPGGQGDCTAQVAVSDTQNLHVEFTATDKAGPYYQRPCVAATALMALLIQNIKSGSA